LKLNLLLKDNEIRALRLKVNPNDEIERLITELNLAKETYEQDLALLREENAEYEELLKETQE